MNQFGLPESVNLFSSEHSTLIVLWGMFATACFAAGAFAGLSKTEHPVVVAVAVILGFWIFAGCNIVLVVHSLKIMASLRDTILTLSQSHKNALPETVSSLKLFVGDSVTFWQPVIAQMVIGVCVTLAVGFQALRPATSK